MKKTPRIFTPITSFKNLVEQMVDRGDKVAFRFRIEEGYDALSYGAFAERVLALAAGFDAVGLAGKRVAVIGETSTDWVATYLAVTAGGGVIVPMDKELAISEIEGFLAGVEAEAIVYSPTFHEKLAHARAEHPTLKLFIPMAGAVSEGNVLTLDDVAEKGKTGLENGFALPDRDPESPAVMLFTSGTTGTSKCVLLCERNLVAATNAACDTVNFSADDTTMSVLPLHHTYELTIMLASLTYGMTVSINDSLKHLMKNLSVFKPTGLVLVPLFVTTMYKRIWDEAKKKGKDKLLRRMLKVSNGLRHIGIDLRRKLFADVLAAFGGRLCKIICGGAPLNPEMVKCYDALGIPICEGYGITECSPLIAVTPYDAPKPGSVGPAVSCCEVRIADGQENEHGFDEGEIQVKGENVMLGYYHNDEENAKAFTEDGWYCTGDIGYLDADNYIHITGRKKSVIVLENGKNVFPEEIEEYLGEIAEIKECVVVGRKQEDDTVALTVLAYPNRDLFDPDATDAQIYSTLWAKLTELNKTLPSFKKIKALEVRNEEFTKTTSMKIKRHLVQ